jgi:transposase-like protein
MNIYNRHRFPPDIISYAVWLYYRFNLSHRDIEDLLAGRGITVSRESIRLWCIKFGAIYTRRLKRKHRGYGDTFFLDECSSESTAISIISGGLWIRMAKLLMYFYRRVVTAQ